LDSGETPSKPKRRAPPTVLESKTFKDGAIYLYRRAEYKNRRGFTSSTVSVRRGSTIYVYDAQGRQVSSVFAGEDEMVIFMATFEVAAEWLIPT